MQVYEQALRLMQKRAPGFAPAWEDALAEAQREADQADTGIIGMVRKAFRPALSSPAPRQVIDADATEADMNPGVNRDNTA